MKTKAEKLSHSIHANGETILSLYNRLEKRELDPAPGFQRKLVWRKQHKYDFISTILQNFPFPEVYIAPGKINMKKKSITDLIVDGQQRLTTIRNYINEHDVFALAKLPIPRWSELNENDQKEFLGYEVSVRYLKNTTEEQIKDIFQRINSTEYALNATERINAQWGDSEFICFAKQLVEEELDINEELVNYLISKSNRKYYLKFFHKKYQVFTGNDVNRMLSLQYMLTLIATLCEGKYFMRNIKIQDYVESQFEDFTNAGAIDNSLLTTLKYIDSINLEEDSYWFNKANLFTLIVELFKYDTSAIKTKEFKDKLLKLEKDNLIYLKALKEKKVPAIPKSHETYIAYSREGMNSIDAREYRGSIVRKMIKSCLK